MSAGLRLSFALLALLSATIASARCPDPQRSLREACPELLGKLDRAGLVSVLELNLEQPAEKVLVARLRAWLRPPGSTAASAAADHQLLNQLLAEHYEPPATPQKSLMERFLAWWASLFDQQTPTPVRPTIPNFWGNLVPSQALARVLFYGISALLLILLVRYGWREARPLLKARREHKRLNRAKQRLGQVAWPPDLSGLGPQARLHRLFHLVVEALTQLGRLPAVPGLTHQELSQTYRPEDHEARFANLSTQAASSLFAGHEPSASELESALQDARALLYPSAPGKPADA